MMGGNYSIKEVAEVLSASLNGANMDVSRAISQIATDSRYRNIGSGTLFFALTSESNDGHKYIPHAYKAGVRMFVVDQAEKVEFENDAVYLGVENTLNALQDLACHHRKRISYPVLAITGSNGKTVLKEWFYQVASKVMHVFRSPKSYNSQIGVPLSILMMPLDADLAIIEAGISQVGEMERLERMIRPSIGLITNVHHAHLENFADQLELASEKVSLFKNCPLIYEQEASIISKALSATRRNADQDLSWSLHKGSSAKGQVHTERLQGKSKVKLCIEGRDLQVSIPFVDDASIENVIGCLMLTFYFKLPWSKIQDQFPNLSPVAMRLQQLAGINQCTLINDSYNSDLTSLEIALRFLNMQNQHQKSTLILSDIVQSGMERSSLYQKVNDLCIANGIDQVIGIGKEIEQASGEFHLPFRSYPSTSKFIEALNPMTFFDEAILIKGARKFEFEKISSVLEFKKHETKLEVNLSAIIENLNHFKSLIDPKTKLMVMVKAFSYGTGSYEIANVLQHHGVDYLAVAYIDEGIALRQNGITMPIVIVNSAVGGLEDIVKFQLEPEIFNLDSLYLLDAFVKKSGNNIKIHLKIETGMNRLGIDIEDVPKVIDVLNRNEQIELGSIFSHLVASDDADADSFSMKQFQRLEKVIASIEKELNARPLHHLVNSDGIVRFPQMHLDMVRLGIGLYGISSLPEVQKIIRPVVSLKTTISQLKSIKKGENVGYARVFTADREMRTATIPVGYADGIGRNLGNGQWSCLIRGQKASIVGNVCMDMCMLDISHIEDAQVNDEVVVLGPDNDIYEMAAIRQTIPYEILTSFSTRIKRVFYYGA